MTISKVGIVTAAVTLLGGATLATAQTPPAVGAAGSTATQAQTPAGGATAATSTGCATTAPVDSSATMSSGMSADTSADTSTIEKHKKHKIAQSTVGTYSNASTGSSTPLISASQPASPPPTKPQ